eukprot:9210512-Lingulodinium_polyedra.AAC.1
MALRWLCGGSAAALRSPCGAGPAAYPATKPAPRRRGRDWRVTCYASARARQTEHAPDRVGKKRTGHRVRINI